MATGRNPLGQLFMSSDTGVISSQASITPPLTPHITPKPAHIHTTPVSLIVIVNALLVYLRLKLIGTTTTIQTSYPPFIRIKILNYINSFLKVQTTQYHKK